MRLLLVAAAALSVSAPASAVQYLVVDITSTGTGWGSSNNGQSPFSFTGLSATFAFNAGGSFPPTVVSNGLRLIGTGSDTTSNGRSDATGLQFSIAPSPGVVTVQQVLSGSACFSNASPTTLPSGSYTITAACDVQARFSDSKSLLAYSFLGPVTSVRFSLVDMPSIPSTSISISNVTSVPEPAAWAMLVTGFGLVGGLIRRRVRISYAV